MEPDRDPQQMDSPASTFVLVVLGLIVAKGSSMMLADAGATPWEWRWDDLVAPITGLVGAIGMLLFALSHRLRDRRSRAYVWLRHVARLFVWALVLGWLLELIGPDRW